MNRIRVAFLAFLLLAALRLSSASLPLSGYFQHRFHPETVMMRDIEGLNERIVDGKLHLRLKDFLELVLKNSTDINLTRLDVYTAADQITAAKAPFDPSLVGGFNTLRSIAPESTQISGASTLSDLEQTSTLNYQQVLPTGETLIAGFTAIRSTSNSEFSFYNPNIAGTFNFQFTQPLWQGRTALEFKTPLLIARSQLVITSEQSEETIADTVSLAAQQYWEAIRARDNIKVEQQTFELAQKSYAHDKQALDLGALADLDIFQSETQLAERKRDLIGAQFSYQASLDGLRRFMGADLTPALRNTEIVLEDDPAALPSKIAILPFEEALTGAMEARPRLSAARRRTSLDDLNARLARDLLKPRLDLTLNASANGLGGNSLPVITPLGVTIPAVNSGLGTALGQLFAFNYPSYGGGLQFTFPLRNSSAAGQLADALVNKTRDRYSERQIQQQIVLDVRQAIDAIELAKATIDAATTARDLAKKNVDAEQQKYDLGTITAFEVLDSQSRLASAESALLNANVTYQEAYISYERATWKLLDGMGMVLQTPKVK
jgi:outer membrane protein TolC